MYATDSEREREREKRSLNNIGNVLANEIWNHSMQEARISRSFIWDSFTQYYATSIMNGPHFTVACLLLNKS